MSKVYMDNVLFEAFVKGFLEVVGSEMTPAEIEYMAFSAKLMTYECGIRFLTDYLEGDVYFKISYPMQNLDRTRTQFKLVSDMEKKMDYMKGVVKGMLKPVLDKEFIPAAVFNRDFLSKAKERFSIALSVKMVCFSI